MNKLARSALEKLLVKAEDKTCKPTDEGCRETNSRILSLCFTEKHFPAYLRIETHGDKTDCHAELILAERAGAINIDWDPRAGTHGAIDRITLTDPEKLAAHLKMTPRWAIMAHVDAVLGPLCERYPVLKQVAEAWQRGVQARSTRPSDLDDWLDAVRLVDYCYGVVREGGGELLPIRRLSIELFRDSKRIEAIAPQVDVLLQADISAVAREREEVLAEIGVFKYPQTVLLAGKLSIDTIAGERFDIPQPYIGLAPSSINRFVANPTIKYLLSIENLESFHAFVERQAPDNPGVVLYSGGMPGPSWLTMYGRLLNALPNGIQVLHWGDIDAGGFRIAGHIAYRCAAHGRRLGLHQMAVAKVMPAGNGSTGIVSRKNLSSAELAQICRICDRWEWHAERDSVIERPTAIEQEGLPLHSILAPV